ncbi:MAG TPA: TetR/AcrR family transcriptional regulator [Roseiarcus sp.]|nr:TetR/AcrR family transcriptional regulator [Roseiarcus sp.]
MLESSVFPDHRTRVAAERRARMHRKLVESALLVFAEKGVDASVIEDVIAAADVSRGTFYNYFRTNGELLAAAILELGNELVEDVEERVKSIPSPAARIFTGLRLYMDAARRFPLFARFVARIGTLAIGPGNLVNAYIPVHIADAVERGEFVEASVQIALDMIVGVGVTIVARIALGDADDAYVNAMLLALARALGFDLAHADALLSEPLAPLDLGAESLLVRSQARFRKQKRR